MFSLASDENASVLFRLNGEQVLLRDVPPHCTLLDSIRSLGLTGTKEACAEGECGACTIVMVKPHGQGSAYTPVNSCIMFTHMAEGQEVYTVEALAANGNFHSVQRALASGGGSQCGYCTPGFVMSLFAEYYRPGRTGPCDPHALSGNLCRCTGYRPIRDAALSLHSVEEDRFAKRLVHPAPSVGPIPHRGTRFSRPATVTDCLDTLAAVPDAQVICGGTDLAVESNLRSRRFAHLVSLEALEDLRSFRESPHEVEIGAALTLSEIERHWQSQPAAVREWFPLFASPMIRNRATLGGNLATASPIGDAAPLLLALGASLKLISRAGERIVPLDQFFLGYRKTVLAPGELIVSVLIPRPYPAIARFYKVAKRRIDDISTVAACLSFDHNSAGRMANPRFAYGGVAASPIRLTEAEELAEGNTFDHRMLRELQAAIARNLHPISDQRGSARYRLAMAGSLMERFAGESREALV